MIAPRIALLFVAAAVLAGCAIPVRTDPAVEDRLVIRGEMFCPERLALTPDSVAIDDGLRGSADRAGNPFPGAVARDTYRFEIDPEGRLVLHTTRQQSIAARR